MTRNRWLTRRTALRTGAAVGGLLGVGTGTVTAQSNGSCTYQVDLVAGEPNEVLGESEDDYYGRQNRLIQYLHGDEGGVLERDTWLNSLDPEIRASVVDETIQVEGGSASVRFWVAERRELALSLVVYSLPGGEFSFETADEQDLVDATTGTFGPGLHRLEAALPCDAPVIETTRVVRDSGERGSWLSFTSLALQDGTLFAEAGKGSELATYVFTETDSGWVESQKLDASVSSLADRSHWSIAVDGDTLFVGVPFYDGPEQDGAVYVYEREPETGTWTQRQLLFPDGESTHFGVYVDVDGSTALVTAAHATYIFSKTDTGEWRLETTPWDGPDWIYVHGALSEGTAVIGVKDYGNEPDTAQSVNEVRVYDRTAGWNQTATLLSDVTPGSNIWIDINGDRIVVGVIPEWTEESSPGTVHVFERTNNCWEETATITSSDTVPGERFGQEIALDGERLLVGVSYKRRNRLQIPTGSAYLFEKRDGVWTQQARFLPQSEGNDDLRTFGESVALDGNHAAIGSPFENDQRGTVYVVEF